MAFVDKTLDKIGVSEAELDDEYTEDEYDFEEENNGNVSAFSRNTARKRSNRENVVSFPTAAQQKMVIYRPVCFEDTRSIVDNFKSRKPVIVNVSELAETDVPMAQRILDYVNGAAYALGGRIHRIDYAIYCMAPANYDVMSTGSDSEEESEGL